MRNRNLKWAAAAAFVIVLGAASGARSAEQEPDRTGGPYVPTPQIVVDEMLRLAAVRADDYVIDLGSGDGVIVLTAAKRYRARGLGIEIDPELVKQSNGSAKRLGVSDRVSFLVQDVFLADVSRASVLTLYLLPEMMMQLKTKLFRELRPGARVVSHDYDFGDDWLPDDEFTFDVPEKEDVNGVPRATIYLWIVPAKVEGSWRLTIDGASEGAYDINLAQRYQAFSGSASAGGRRTAIEVPALRGDGIRFAVASGAGRHVFHGRVKGSVMEGTVTLGNGKGTAHWTARRM